eukprot:SM000074S21674  [mRNA]  locus=s74:210664:213053:- [translate_table: standard]
MQGKHALPEPPARPAAQPSMRISAFPDFQRLPRSSHRTGDPTSIAGARKAAIVWFRNDLRIHDNEALAAATKESLAVMPVYCFDPRDFGEQDELLESSWSSYSHISEVKRRCKYVDLVVRLLPEIFLNCCCIACNGSRAGKSSSGFDKTGPYRAKFLVECVEDLRRNLRKHGSDLVVRIGKPEDVLLKLAKATGADALFVHQEVTAEELRTEERVATVLKDEGVETKFFWGSTLYHVDDLPFKLADMPSSYGSFREVVQRVEVRKTMDDPDQLKGLPVKGHVEAGKIPTLSELGLNPMGGGQHLEQPASSSSYLVGGENEALARLRCFVSEASSQAGKVAPTSSDSLYGANFSCKISPWLAMGCLSPRRMYEDLRHKGGRTIGATASRDRKNGEQSNSLDWLVFELLWRDFFRFITKKFGVGRAAPAATQAVACA